MNLLDILGENEISEVRERPLVCDRFVPLPQLANDPGFSVPGQAAMRELSLESIPLYLSFLYRATLKASSTAIALDASLYKPKGVESYNTTSIVDGYCPERLILVIRFQ